MAYGPTEIGIQEMDQRPYGNSPDAQAEELKRAKQLAEAQGGGPVPTMRPKGSQRDAYALDPRIPPPGDQAVGPGPYMPPIRQPMQPQPQSKPFWEPQEGEQFGLTGALNALDYITKAGRTTVGAALPEGIPFFGEKGPTDATQSDSFLPAAASWVLSSVLNSNALVSGVRAGLTASSEEGTEVATQMDPVSRGIAARVDDLVARGADEESAFRVASLENTYNTLGAVGSLAAGLALGVPATIAAGIGAVVQQTDPDTYKTWQERAERSLPAGSFGGLAVEFGVPELGVVTGAAKAIQVARLRFAATVSRNRQVGVLAMRRDELMRQGKTQEQAVSQLIDDYGADRVTRWGTTGEDISHVEQAAVDLAEDARAIEATFAADLATDATPDALVTRAEITAERIRADAEVARTTGESLTVMNEADEVALYEGIRAAVDALPAGERATVSVGEALVKATSRATSSMKRTLKAALSKGEMFRMQSVTVGADAENNAIRARMMVGSFDRDVERLREAFRAAGKPADEITALLAPFLRARSVAAETLAAIEAHNSVIKADIALSQTERSAALKAVKDARKAEAKAESKVSQTQKAEAKAGERIGKQEVKEQAQATQRVDALQQKIETQKARIAREREVIAKVGGDKDPIVTSKSDLTAYPNADDVRYLEEQGVTNLGSWGPTTVRAMREWIEQDPTRASLGYQHVEWSAITQKTSDLTGVDLAKIRAQLPETGELTRAMYVLNQTFGAKLRAWRDLGQQVKKGLATPAQMEEATKDLMLLQSDIRSGIGEVARTLGAQRLLKKPDLVELVNLKTIVRARYADVERIAKRIDNLEGKMAEAAAAEPSDALLTLRTELAAAAQESERAIAALEDAKAAVSAATERNLRAALDLAAKRAVTPEKMAVWALYDGEDLVDLAAELRKLEPAGLGPFAQRVLIAGRYGRIPSQIVNFFDTGLNALYSESFVAAGAHFAPAGHIAGVSDPLFAAKGEVGRTWMGMWGAAPDASRFWGRTFWQGSAEDIAIRHGIADFETLVGQGLDAPANFFRIGGREFDISGPKWLPLDATLRALYASDGFWRILLNDGNAIARAMREGTDIRSFVEADRAIREAARERGLVTTYNRPYGEKGLDAILKALGKTDLGGFQWLRVLIPAARFGARFVETGLMSAGGGLVSGTLRARAARGIPDEFLRVSEARAAAREQAAGAIGAVQFAIGTMLVASGVVSGPLPKSESERLAWQRIGKKPMSVKIGDNWVPLGWFGAPAAGLALSATVFGAAESEKDDSVLSDLVHRTVFGLGQYMIDQPALYAGRQLLDGIWTAVQYQNTAELERSAANAFKPGAATQSFGESFTAVFDRYQRDPEGLLQLLMAKAPLASMAVPPKIDPATGKPLERSVSGPAALLQSEFESAGTERTPTDPVEKAIVEVGAGISSMERTITSGSAEKGGTVKLTQDEYVALSQKAGALGHDIATRIIQSDAYRAMDVRGKQTLIARAYDEARQEARKELAVRSVATAQKPEDAQRALIMSRAALSEDQYANAVRMLWGRGMLTDQVIAVLDESRPSFKSPTVEQMVGR